MTVSLPSQRQNSFVRHMRTGHVTVTFASDGRRTMCNALMCMYVTTGWHVPLQNASSRGDLDPHLIYGSLDPPTPVCPKQHLDRFSHFCTADPCAQHTQRQTDTQTMLHVTSVAICNVCRRCGLIIHTVIASITGNVTALPCGTIPLCGPSNMVQI